MKISTSAADAFVAKPDSAIAAALVYGPDRGLVRERGAGLAASFGADPDDPFGLVDLTESDLKGGAGRLTDELLAYAFGGGSRVVRVRLDGDTAGAAIEHVLKDIDSGAVVPVAKLVVEAGELTPRSKTRKAFEGAKKAAALACYLDSALDLARLADETLSAAGVRIDRDARDRLVPLLEGDRALARGELEKLALYASSTSEAVTVADIDAVVAGAEPVSLDDVAFSAASGDLPAADRAVSLALSEGVSAVGICRAVQRHLVRLQDGAARVARGDRPESAAQAARPPVFGPRRSEYVRQLKLWNEKRLGDVLAEALRAEVRLKTRGAAEAAVLGRLVLAVAGAARRR